MKFGRILVRWLLIVFVVLVTAIAIGGFFLPSQLEVTEERLISLPAPELYDRLALLKKWPEWAPWWRQDPFLQTEFAGPDSGAGAAMKWLSKQNGEGQGKITAVIPNQELALALDFGDRGEGSSLIRLEESADHQQTRVRWSFSMSFGLNTGRRYFGLFFRNSVRKSLAEALENLEQAAQTRTPVAGAAAVEKPVPRAD